MSRSFVAKFYKFGRSLAILVVICCGALSQANGGSAVRYVPTMEVAQRVSDSDAVHPSSDGGPARDGSNSSAAHFAPNADASRLVPSAAAGNFVSNGDAVHFRYYGHWEHVRNVRDGRLFGSSSRTASSASSVTFFFKGTQARIYGVRGPGGGRGVLTIDGDRYFDVDFYAPAKLPQAVIYSTPVLSKGEHFLVVTPEAYPRTPHHHSSYVNISGASFQ